MLSNIRIKGQDRETTRGSRVEECVGEAEVIEEEDEATEVAEEVVEVVLINLDTIKFKILNLMSLLRKSSKNLKLKMCRCIKSKFWIKYYNLTIPAYYIHLSRSTLNVTTQRLWLVDII